MTKMASSLVKDRSSTEGPARQKAVTYLCEPFFGLPCPLGDKWKKWLGQVKLYPPDNKRDCSDKYYRRVRNILDMRERISQLANCDTTKEDMLSVYHSFMEGFKENWKKKMWSVMSAKGQFLFESNVFRFAPYKIDGETKLCVILFVGTYAKDDSILRVTETAEKDQKEALKLREEAGGFYKSSNFQDALEQYNKAIKKDPYDSRLYYNRAACYITIKNPSDAMWDCLRAIALNKSYIKAHKVHVRALSEMDRIGEAMMASEWAMRACEGSEGEADYDPLLKQNTELRSKVTNQFSAVPEVTFAHSTIIRRKNQLNKVNVKKTTHPSSSVTKASVKPKGPENPAIVAYRNALETGSKVLQEQQFRNAVTYYDKCHKLLQEHTSKVLEVSDDDVAILKYAYGYANLALYTEAGILAAVEVFQDLIENYKLILAVRPLAYYGAGSAYFKLNRFGTALQFFSECLIIESRTHFGGILTWPGTTVSIPVTEKDKLREEVEKLVGMCKWPRLPDTKCVFEGCGDSGYPQMEIYFDGPDFKGYIRVICSDHCCLSFHLNCWRKIKQDFGEKIVDKDMVGIPCLTPDCSGISVTIIIYTHDNEEKTQVNITPEVQEKLLAAKGELPALQKTVLKLPPSSEWAKEKKAKKKVARRERRDEATKERKKLLERQLTGDSEDLEEDDEILSALEKKATKVEEDKGTSSAQVVGNFQHLLKREKDDENQEDFTKKKKGKKQKQPKVGVLTLDEFQSHGEDREPSDGAKDEGGAVPAVPADVEMFDSKYQAVEDLMSYEHANIREAFVSVYTDILRNNGPLYVEDSELTNLLIDMPTIVQSAVSACGNIGQLLRTLSPQLFLCRHEFVGLVEQNELMNPRSTAFRNKRVQRLAKATSQPAGVVTQEVKDMVASNNADANNQRSFDDRFRQAREYARYREDIESREVGSFALAQASGITHGTPPILSTPMASETVVDYPISQSPSDSTASYQSSTSDTVGTAIMMPSVVKMPTPPLGVTPPLDVTPPPPGLVATPPPVPVLAGPSQLRPEAQIFDPALGLLPTTTLPSHFGPHSATDAFSKALAAAKASNVGGESYPLPSYSATSVVSTEGYGSSEGLSGLEATELECVSLESSISSTASLKLLTQPQGWVGGSSQLWPEARMDPALGLLPSSTLSVREKLMDINSAELAVMDAATVRGVTDQEIQCDLSVNINGSNTEKNKENVPKEEFKDREEAEKNSVYIASLGKALSVLIDKAVEESGYLDDVPASDMDADGKVDWLIKSLLPAFQVCRAQDEEDCNRVNKEMESLKDKIVQDKARFQADMNRKEEKITELSERIVAKSNECNNANQRVTNSEKRHKVELRALEETIRELKEAAAKGGELKKAQADMEKMKKGVQAMEASKRTIELEMESLAVQVSSAAQETQRQETRAKRAEIALEQAKCDPILSKLTEAVTESKNLCENIALLHLPNLPLADRQSLEKVREDWSNYGQINAGLADEVRQKLVTRVAHLEGGRELGSLPQLKLVTRFPARPALPFNEIARTLQRDPFLPPPPPGTDRGASPARALPAPMGGPSGAPLVGSGVAGPRSMGPPTAPPPAVGPMGPPPPSGGPVKSQNPFEKIIRRLQETHPHFTKDEITKFISMFRANNGNSLSGLTTDYIFKSVDALIKTTTDSPNRSKLVGPAPSDLSSFSVGSGTKEPLLPTPRAPPQHTSTSSALLATPSGPALSATSNFTQSQFGVQGTLARFGAPGDPLPITTTSSSTTGLARGTPAGLLPTTTQLGGIGRGQPTRMSAPGVIGSRPVGSRSAAGAGPIGSRPPLRAPGSSAIGVHVTDEAERRKVAENECIICYNKLRGGATMRLECCRRYYHTECITKWFKENSTCPTCRTHALLQGDFPRLGA